MPLKGQSELCASEPLGIFRSGPELWCEHWTHLPERRSLCADLALGEVVMLENFDIGAPCMSFPYPSWEFHVMGIQHLSSSADSKLEVSRRIVLHCGDSHKGQPGGTGAGTEQQDSSGNWGRSLRSVLLMSRAANAFQTRNSALLASPKEWSDLKRKTLPQKELSIESALKTQKKKKKVLLLFVTFLW